MPFCVQMSFLYSVESMFVLTSHLRFMTCHGVFPSVSAVVVAALSSPHIIKPPSGMGEPSSRPMTRRRWLVGRPYGSASLKLSYVFSVEYLGASS